MVIAKGLEKHKTVKPNFAVITEAKNDKRVFITGFCCTERYSENYRRTNLGLTEFTANNLKRHYQKLTFYIKDVPNIANVLNTII